MIKDYHAFLVAGLFHDIGKLFQRLEYVNRLQRIDEMFKDLFGASLLELANLQDYGNLRRHERFSVALIDCILHSLGTSIDKNVNDLARILLRAKDLLIAKHDLIQRADVISSGERAPEYNEAVAKLINILGLDPTSAPFMSPLWILDIHKHKDTWQKFTDLIYRFANAIKEKDSYTIESIVKELADILSALKEKNYFIPPMVLNWNDMLKWEVNGNAIIPPYKFLPLRFSIGDQLLDGYEKVATAFIRELKKLLDLLKNGYINGLGLIESLSTVLKRTLLFVPAGVYGALLPDTSLYAHTKSVAALSYLFGKTNTNAYSLLLIDFGGIQKFISILSRNKGASKILRGKSTLVELLHIAIAGYIRDTLHLTKYNEIVSSGGNILFIVPRDINLDKLINALDNLSLNELLGILSFNVSVSKDIFKEIKFTDIIDSVGGKVTEFSITDALRDLHKKLSEQKLRQIKKGENIRNLFRSFLTPQDTLSEAAKGYEICSILGIPIPQNSQQLIRVSGEKFDTLNSFAPEIVEEGAYISKLSWYLLLLGHLIRNAKMIVRVFIRNNDDFKNFLRTHLTDLSSTYLRDMKYTIGILPLRTLNTVFYVISAKDEKANPWELAKSALQVILKDIEDSIRGPGTIEIIVINEIENAIPTTQQLSALKGLLGKLSDKITLVIDARFMNTYHPTDEQGRFVELDRLVSENGSGLLALAKIDGDNIGKIIQLLSPSPSRFITFSELIQFYFGGLSYSLIFAQSVQDYLQLRGISPHVDKVIILYGGGDDTSVYGEWKSVTHYISVLREGMKYLLHPITASGAIIIDDPNSPIADLYLSVVENLEFYAKKEKCVDPDLCLSEAIEKDSLVFFRDPLPHVSHKQSIDKPNVNLIPISYGADYSEVRYYLERLHEIKAKKSILYTLYDIALGLSNVLKSIAKRHPYMDEQRLIELDNKSLMEIYNMTLRLIYFLSRRKKDVEELKKIIKPLEYFKIDRIEALRLLYSINRILPVLRLIILGLRT